MRGCTIWTWQQSFKKILANSKENGGRGVYSIAQLDHFCIVIWISDFSSVRTSQPKSQRSKEQEFHKSFDLVLSVFSIFNYSSIFYAAIQYGSGKVE